MKTKTCKICKTSLPIGSFRKLAYKLASGKSKHCYANICKKCKYAQAREDVDRVRRYDAEWKRKWRATHKDKVHEINQKVYYKNRDKYLAQKHQYYLLNKDRILAYNKSYLQTTSGRQKNRNGGAKYEASKYKAKIEKVDREVVYKRDKGICYLCGKLANKENWQLEHVIPLSRGGEHSYANVAVSHAKCNQSKRAKTPKEYFDWLEKLIK